IRLLFAQYMRVDSQRQFGAGVTELFSDPLDALARGEREAGIGVARAVKLERPHTDLLCTSSNATPGAPEVVLIDRATAAYALFPLLSFGVLGLGAEHPLGYLGPTPPDRLLPSQREQIEQR